MFAESLAQEELQGGFRPLVLKAICSSSLISLMICRLSGVSKLMSMFISWALYFRLLIPDNSETSTRRLFPTMPGRYAHRYGDFGHRVTWDAALVGEGALADKWLLGVVHGVGQLGPHSRRLPSAMAQAAGGQAVAAHFQFQLGMIEQRLALPQRSPVTVDRALNHGCSGRGPQPMSWPPPDRRHCAHGCRQARLMVSTTSWQICPSSSGSMPPLVSQSTTQSAPHRQQPGWFSWRSGDCADSRQKNARHHR